MIPKKKKLKRKHLWPNIITSVFLIGFVLLVIGFLVLSNVRIYQKRSELKAQINQLGKEVEKLEKQKADLVSGLAQTQGENFLEQEARDTLNYQKPGEEVTVVVPPATTSEQQEQPEGFWQGLLKKLGF